LYINLIFILSDELRDAPDKILELISSKHYLTATKYLLKYLEIANNIDYQSIGALDDIRHDLNVIKAVIFLFKNI